MLKGSYFVSKRPQTNSFFQILHKFSSLASTASSANAGLRFKSIAIFVCLLFFSAPPRALKRGKKEMVSAPLRLHCVNIWTWFS